MTVARIKNGASYHGESVKHAPLAEFKKVAPYRCKCRNTVCYQPCVICAALAAKGNGHG